MGYTQETKSQDIANATLSKIMVPPTLIKLFTFCREIRTQMKTVLQQFQEMRHSLGPDNPRKSSLKQMEEVEKNVEEIYELSTSYVEDLTDILEVVFNNIKNDNRKASASQKLAIFESFLVVTLTIQNYIRFFETELVKTENETNENYVKCAEQSWADFGVFSLSKMTKKMKAFLSLKDADDNYLFAYADSQINYKLNSCLSNLDEPYLLFAQYCDTYSLEHRKCQSFQLWNIGDKLKEISNRVRKVTHELKRTFSCSLTKGLELKFFEKYYSSKSQVLYNRLEQLKGLFIIAKKKQIVYQQQMILQQEMMQENASPNPFFGYYTQVKPGVWQPLKETKGWPTPYFFL